MPTNPRPGCRNGNASHRTKSGPACFGFRTLLLLAASFALAGVVPIDAQNPPNSPLSRPVLPPDANTIPDQNEQMRMHEQQNKDQARRYAAANAERKKQITDDSAKLVLLATALKSEVDKTSKDTLSLTIIRQADEIEKLAHGVKEKMKLVAGAN